MATNRARPAGPGRHQRPDTLGLALDAIRRIVQALRTSARQAERELGVSGAQLFVLHTLAERPAASLNDLAARTFTHQSSVSVVVHRLVRRGLVSRTRSPDDGRRVQLALTPRGRAVLRAAPEIAQLRLIRALHDLPERDRRALTRILGHIVRRMGAPGRPALFFEDLARPDGPRPTRRRRALERPTQRRDR
jgi:DNA-binding MarR family transcriptional regulator